MLTFKINRYNLYGANKDLKLVFGDVQRFLRCVSRTNTRRRRNILTSHRWRVALHEKSIQLLDFVNVDQTIQVHGMLRTQNYDIRKYT